MLLRFGELSLLARHPSIRNQGVAADFARGKHHEAQPHRRPRRRCRSTGRWRACHRSRRQHRQRRHATVAKAQAAVPALTPAQVKFVEQSWGDPKTELGVVILAPKGWNMVKLSTFEAKFTSSNKLWNVRMNGVYPGETPVTRSSRRRRRRCRGSRATPDLADERQDEGDEPVIEGETYTTPPGLLLPRTAARPAWCRWIASPMPSGVNTPPAVAAGSRRPRSRPRTRDRAP